MSTVIPADEAAALTADGSVAAWTQRYTGAVMDTFGPPQRVLVRGEGAYVWDADGKRYLDLLAGIAVNALGHAHPTLTAAVSAQLGTLGHVSNFFGSPTQIALAERLLDLAQAPEGSRVFFTNSGTEANEAAIKMARRNRDGVAGPGTRTTPPAARARAAAPRSPGLRGRVGSNSRGLSKRGGSLPSTTSRLRRSAPLSMALMRCSPARSLS